MTFKCRVCGHDEYTKEYIGSELTGVYICSKCSVVFLDPKMFSKTKTLRDYANDHYGLKGPSRLK